MVSDMPKYLRWGMVFIDRVGFPIVAFLLMCYMCFVSLKNLNDVLTQNTGVLSALKNQIEQQNIQNNQRRG